MEEEFFEPLLGKIRSRDMGMSKRYSHMVLAVINRAGGRKRSKRFTGKRLGRGGAIGAVLASRDQYSAFRQRRTIIDKGRDFTLVPWRPVLDHHIGKQISGTISPDGISWTIGKQRGLGIG